MIRSRFIFNNIILIFFILFAKIISSQNQLLFDRSSNTNCLHPFYHGVASGDPKHDKVIIWTRYTPLAAEVGSVIPIQWRVALDTGMTMIVQSGVALTDSSRDFTVKVDVTGLNPNTYYYYEFQKGSFLSIRGRTKTLPLPGANTDSIRFAVLSCANYESGLFNVYAALLSRGDFDAVIFLGDYIYEYETGGYGYNTTVNRSWSPLNEIISISDYRVRYSTYRLDNDLRKLHQQFPFICVYDDHEFSNDAWWGGAQNHQSNEGPWSSRKYAAQKAYFEWMPIRDNPSYDVYRSFKWGNLINLIMLDTRVEGRDIQAGTTGTVVTSPNRKMISTTQLNWLKSELLSNEKWKVIGQQVMIAPLKVFGNAVNGDQWDGYPAERDRIFNHIIVNNIENVVILTGDIHTSWANELPTATYDPNTGNGSVGVEFVTPSVTSPNSPLPVPCSTVKLANSHIKFCDLTEKGFMIIDVNQQRVQSDWFFISTLDYPSSAHTHAASYFVLNNQRKLNSNNNASFPRQSLLYQTYAPPCPRTLNLTGTNDQIKNNILISLYPNPSSDYLIIHGLFEHLTKNEIEIQIFNIEGKLIKHLKEETNNKILKYYLPIQDLQSAEYIIRLKMNNEVHTLKFIKK